MPNYICTTCGNEYAASEQPPRHCPICEDERQYVNPAGQSWTTLEAIQKEHHNQIRTLEPGLLEIGTMPKFGIGQRALLVQTPKGNTLWDCVSLIDTATVTAIEALGGISALAMSHPHMFGSMVEWSHAFGNAPIYLHTDFQAWVQRPDPVIKFWEGDELELPNGLKLYRCGGHFSGSTVLLWPGGAEGRGTLLSSDTLHVCPDQRHVSFMYSYPNHIPLAVSDVEAVFRTVNPLKFDRMHSSFYNLTIATDAQGAVHRSVERYKRMLSAQS